MLKIIFMAKETLSSVKAFEFLCDNKQKTEIVCAVVRKKDEELYDLCQQNNVRILNEDELENLHNQGCIEADYIFSFYWKRIRKSVLNIPSKGSINFHPGPLPEARGSGYHRAILENWGYFGVTAHYMDEDFDTGPIIECRHFQVDNNVVNKDLVRITHENLYLLFEDITEFLLGGGILKAEIQTEGTYYSLTDLERSKFIEDNEDIEDIDRKIRAFWNPPYSGAIIKIKGKCYTVINEEILNWIADNLR